MFSRRQWPGMAALVVSQRMTRPPGRVRYDVLAARVGEILHYVWDPIGVVRYPQARDEYDNYVPQVVEMLLQEKTADDIAMHLSRIETERMGLSATSTA